MLNKWLPVWSKPMEKPIRTVEPRMEYQHPLVYNKDYTLWHCTSCLSNFRKKQSAKHKPCDQLASHMLAVIVQAHECGHTVWICNMPEANDKLMYCNRCGCYAQVKPDGLLKRCKATASSQRQRLETSLCKASTQPQGPYLGNRGWSQSAPKALQRKDGADTRQSWRNKGRTLKRIKGFK